MFGPADFGVCHGCDGKASGDRDRKNVNLAIIEVDLSDRIWRAIPLNLWHMRIRMSSHSLEKTMEPVAFLTLH